MNDIIYGILGALTFGAVTMAAIYTSKLLNSYLQKFYDDLF